MKKKFIIVAMIIILVIIVIVGTILILKKDNNKEEKEDDYNKEIESFEYNYGSYSGGFREYKIYVEDGKTYVVANGYNGVDINIDKEVDKSVLSDISKIVSENKIYKWNGFNKSDNDIMDGDGFNLKIKYTDGEEINAKGYMKYPKDYKNGHEKLSKYLEQIK